jgi:hypothetical protein
MAFGLYLTLFYIAAGQISISRGTFNPRISKKRSTGSEGIAPLEK